MNTHNICCHVLMAMLFSFLFLQTSKAESEFCTPSCHGQINLSLPQSGFAVITPTFILSGSNNCSGNWTVTVTDPNGNVLPGNVVNCAYLGLTLMASVEDMDTGVSCWGNILVEDKLPPTLTCADVTISCSESTDPSNTGMPTVTDNCFGTPTLTYTDIPIIHNCANPLYDVTIERTWTATDASGNTMSCTQNIFLEKALLSNVVFPPMASVDCSNPNVDPSNTGEPTVSGASFGGFCNLKFGHSDGPQIPTCPGGYKFIREWFIVDCCSDSVLTGNQIIDVTDTTPPVITCPADQTVSVTNTSCTANSVLPLATATDDCSTPTITFSSTSGVISGNDITGLVEGVHTIQYIATDGCGNMDTCEMKITVIDNIAPTPICDLNTVIALDNTGCGILRDSTVDDGSFDNCCIDTFFIRRVGDVNFDHFVKFDCNDLGDTIMVEFKVQDKSGNMNFCMTRVTVQDKIPPTIVCPTNKTINCTDDYLDLGLVGEAIASDACGVDTLYFEDDLTNIDPCTNVGFIIRTWIVRDSSGNSDTCYQGIVLEDTSMPPVFNIPLTDIISCTESFDPSNTGEPIITYTGCNPYSFGYEDLEVVGLDLCDRHIVRTWKIVDDCTNLVVFEGDQLIEVEDDEKPIITCPDDVSVIDIEIINGVCTEIVTNLEATATDECSGILSITHDYLLANNGTNSPIANGLYSVGTTVVTFTATDYCNNTSTCQTNVTVEDITGPTIECSDIAFIIQENIPLILDFSVINNLAVLSNPPLITFSDNCSNPVTFELSQATADFFAANSPFDCDYITTGVTAIIPVTYIFTDLAGNISECNQKIILTDMGCMEQFAVAFAGAAYSDEGTMIKNMEVAISNDMDTMLYTDEVGLYYFGTNDVSGLYTITPQKNNDYLNGVTTYDLVKIRRHILGNELLDSPMKMIAADANHDESITTFDIVSLRNLILQNWDELPDNDSWRFIDATYEFPNLSNPFEEEFPESIDCINETENNFYLNFRGIKVGDVNGSASTDDLISSDTRGTEIVQFNTKDILLEKDELYQIPIYAKDIQQLDGFQFTLDVNTSLLEFVGIEKALLDENNFGYRFVEDGLITASWVNPNNQELNENSVLFFMKIKAKENTVLHDAVTIHSEKTKALAYNQSEQVSDIELFFNDRKEFQNNKKEEFILYQNQPNPFSETTEIRFYLPENSDVELQIVDVSGKTIKTFSNYYLLGEHKIELKSSVFPSGGVYIYKLITTSFSASKKMTIIN